MTYLVLGSNSFAGSVFVDEVLSDEEQVIGISRSEQPNVILRSYGENLFLKNFIFHQLDLNKNISEIKKLILKYKPKYIVDFSNQGMVAESWQHPEQWYMTNIVAKVKLHNFLRTCDFLQRFIRISTPEVYGHSDNKLTEYEPYNPSTPYAVSQAATDMSLMTFYKQYDFPVVFSRFANFYGPHQQLYRIVPKAIIYALINKKFPLHGGGSSKRAFIYGTDVAKAIKLLIKNGKLGETYHFSSKSCDSIAEVIKKICSLTLIDYNQFIEIAPDRPGKDSKYLMDTTKAERELNWHPLVSFEEGIVKTIAWVKKNINVIKGLPLNYIHKP